MKGYFATFLLLLTTCFSTVTQAAVAYARGEFCYEDRYLGQGSDYDFNEACMRYHLLVHYAGSTGLVYEVNLALNPMESGHRDDISLVLNGGLSRHFLKHERSDDGTETTTNIYAGDEIMPASNMFHNTCYGGPVPLFPSSSCVSNAAVITQYGLGTTYLSFGANGDSAEELIAKIVALKNNHTGNIIDHSAMEAGLAKMMFKPPGSAVPAEKVHWFDAFNTSSATADADPSHAGVNNIALSGCDPRDGDLSTNCENAIADYVTTNQAAIKGASQAVSIAMASSTAIGFRIAKYDSVNGDFDQSDVWTVGTDYHYDDSYDSNARTFSSHQDVIDYFTEADHATHRANRTRCDYIKCVWYAP